MFFERDGLVFISHLQPDAGNPVRIGDGSATVTDYKLPKATAQFHSGTGGKAGVRRSPKSGYRSGCARRSRFTGQLLRREKDEASLPVSAGQDSLDAFILRLGGV